METQLMVEIFGLVVAVIGLLWGIFRRQRYSVYQKAGDDSVQIQSGGNVTIRNAKRIQAKEDINMVAGKNFGPWEREEFCSSCDKVLSFDEKFKVCCSSCGFSPEYMIDLVEKKTRRRVDGKYWEYK
jgi:hypothetical protein